ncbi:hypothetical protein LAZ67_5003382, partial [Cordylochernes scorpioides]
MGSLIYKTVPSNSNKRFGHDPDVFRMCSPDSKGGAKGVKIFVRRNSEMEQRAVIKFNAKLGRSASETYILMKQVYGTLCLSKSNVFIWHKRFSDGRNTLEDDKHTGRPSSSKTPESIEKVREFVENNDGR